MDAVAPIELGADHEASSMICSELMPPFLYLKTCDGFEYRIEQQIAQHSTFLWTMFNLVHEWDDELMLFPIKKDDFDFALWWLNAYEDERDDYAIGVIRKATGACLVKLLRTALTLDIGHLYRLIKKVIKERKRHSNIDVQNDIYFALMYYGTEPVQRFLATGDVDFIRVR